MLLIERRRLKFHHLRFNILIFILTVSGLLLLMPLCQGNAADVFSSKKELSTEAGERHVGYSVALDDEGNIFVAGASSEDWGTPIIRYGGGAADCFVAKLDDRGAVQWSTFIGDSGFDVCRAIAVDEKQNVYVTGEAGSPWYPNSRNFGGGSSDCFVTKLDSNGIVRWTVFLGGSQYDMGSALVVDNHENIFVTGNSVSSWGEPINPHKEGNHDGFAAMLDKKGELVWNTFFGNEEYDGSYGIAIDTTGNIFAVGESFKGWGTPVQDFVPGYYGNYGTFIIKFNKHGRIQWNTFIGGSGADYGRGIALDNTGNVYVTGNSDISWGAPLKPHQGGHDAYIARLDGEGFLQWNTFLGGEGTDYARGIVVNWTGNIFLAGQSSTKWEKPVTDFSGTAEAFAMKIEDSGTMQWNTFLGEKGEGFAHNLAVDKIGNVYLTGISTFGEPDRDFIKGDEKSQAFVLKLDSKGTMQWKNFITDE